MSTRTHTKHPMILGGVHVVEHDFPPPTGTRYSIARPEEYLHSPMLTGEWRTQEEAEAAIEAWRRAGANP